MSHITFPKFLQVFEVFFWPRSRSKTQKLMVLAGEASYRPENRILGNDFGRRRCLYPLLLGQIFKKKQFATKKCASTIFFWRRIFFFGVEKSKVANRLKRVFPKFEADRSHVRGVNGRSKFDVVRRRTTLYGVSFCLYVSSKK